jgi:hypothetical protein
MPSADRDRIQAFLERYGAAIGSGDLDTAAAGWAVPALVLADEGAIPIESRDEIEAFFGQAIASYRIEGLVETRPEIERIDVLSDRLVSVDVRWPAFDVTGAERSSERSRYVLRFDAAGDPQIQVAVTLTTD